MWQKDKQILRELARRYMELASSEKQIKMNQRMKDTNDLKLVRPPVLMDEIPWYQMNIGDELTCLCENPRARDIAGNISAQIRCWSRLSESPRHMSPPESALKSRKKSSVPTTPITSSLIAIKIFLKAKNLLNKSKFPPSPPVQKNKKRL